MVVSTVGLERPAPITVPGGPVLDIMDAGLYREFWGGQDGVTTAMNSGGWEVKRRNRVEKISNRKNLNHFFPFIWPRDPLQRVEGYLVSAWPKTATMADIRPGI